MMDDTQYRYEFKYICDEVQMGIIQSKVNALLELDTHAAPFGFYQIRSLYFDDYNNRCFYENEDGTDPREKFRIRIYNGLSNRITLELKKKERGKTLKLSCPLSKEQCLLLMEGKPLPDDPQYHPVLQKLLFLMKTTLMRPVIIVEYTRIPYVCPLGNVRITFDKNISSSSCISDFLNPEIATRPILSTGNHVLEVKYDEFLPDPIYAVTQTEGMQRTAFSKYYLCRKYTI